MALRPRHLRRYRQIVEVLTRHGFEALVTQLNLRPYLNMPRRFRRQTSEPPGEVTPAQHIRLALEELGPTFVKLGQILSTRPDLLPPEFISELSKLQDEVPPAPWEKIKAIIETELDATLDNLFTFFDPTPIAAASLAQVHAATLPNGHKVVVKVQRPDIEQVIDNDLDILYDLARLAQERTALGDYYNLVDLAEEFAYSLRAELDYRREGRNADRFKANFAGESHLYVPQVYWQFTTRRVLAQERIAGIKIDNIEALETAGYDRHQLALHCARLIIKEVLEDGFFHADPHPGNLLVMPGEVIGLMDFGTVGRLTPTDRTNLVRLYIVAVQLDAEGIVEQLVRMGIAGGHLDHTALQRDLQRILLKYYNLPLKDISTRELLEEIQPIIYRHRLQLPSDLWLLVKTFAIMEGVGRRLDPDFDIFAVSKPHVARFLRRLWLPSEWGPGVLRSLTSWLDLTGNLPNHLSRLLHQAERGELTIQINQPAVERTTVRLDHIANRLILGLLLSALIIALALLIPTFNLTWPWNFFTWIIIISFAIMSILALWLIISILRSGRL